MICLFMSSAARGYRKKKKKYAAQVAPEGQSQNYEQTPHIAEKTLLS